MANPLTFATASFRAAAGELLERYRFARTLGLTFNGKRKLYEIFGYPDEITTSMYRDRYARGGIAKRIVEAYPKATWRGGIQVYEDADPEKHTEFEDAFNALHARLQFWTTFQKVDILAGLSTYAVLLIGAPGRLEDELPKGSPDKLFYLQPYSGGGGPSTARRSHTVSLDTDVSIATFDVNPRSERFGEPQSYHLRRTDLATPELARPVHWTRILHVAEGTLDDNIYGPPTLENVWNLIDDLEKVTGGGAEAFFLRANAGLHIDIDKDVPVNPDPAKAAEELEDLKKQIELYQHQIARVLRSRGASLTQLGSDVANFSAPADAIIKQIAGSKGIPMRILTGSEMGQLASGQDADNWDTQVQDRRTSYAEPSIARRLFDRLIKYGYLPTPKQYTIDWPVKEEMTESEKAIYAVRLATVNKTQGTPVITDSEIREMAFDMKPLTPEQLKEIEEQALKKIKHAQMAMIGTGQPEEEDDEDDEDDEAFIKAAEKRKDKGLVRVLAEAIKVGNQDVINQIIGLQHKYASTQIQLPEDVAIQVFKLGLSIPDEEIYEPEGGRERDAHVTVKYGLLDPDPAKLFEVVARRGPISLTFGKTDIFSTPEYDCVYVAVQSADLMDLNRGIEIGMRTAPSDHDAYRPHSTVAYVKPGVGEKYRGMSALEGRTVTVDKIVLIDTEGKRTEVSFV